MVNTYKEIYLWGGKILELLRESGVEVPDKVPGNDMSMTIHSTNPICVKIRWKEG